MASIDDFKANLIGGGARANQFRVTMTPPSGIAIGLDVRRTSFLVTAAQLPASTLTEIPVPFRGRNIYITGDRPAPETWNVRHAWISMDINGYPTFLWISFGFHEFLWMLMDIHLGSAGVVSTR